ncbi:hypothetical protein E3N88_05070 [Mikania micrantha]|uniref:Reverse transcriptase zinc-binding domain-containing protein n=1 Tax=Mikania micrantha TaxID=192012 RepID=A0A5N6PWQ9_9ASTR|nr:hypothetical protein E3N88_05070 [Mikania micrantha]
MLDFGPPPFKLFNGWMELDGFSETVQNAVSMAPFIAAPDRHLLEKLKIIKTALKAWRIEGKRTEDGNKPLCDQFPDLFRKAANKRAKVAEYYNVADGSITWSCPWVSSVNPVDIQAQWSILLNIIKDASLTDMKDGWSWLMLDRLPCRTTLLSRGIHLDSVKCLFCETFDESTDHLFTKCSLARHVWCMLTLWCKIPSFRTLNIEAMIHESGEYFTNTKQKKLF